MNNRDLQIVKKILSEVTIVEALIDGFNLEKFLKDERTKRAACMTLINIGELVKNLTEEFKSKYNLIPWRAIAGMRDITVHKYQL
ncbi:MAG: HepT-like ribonuclease domain-containing protein [Bacillota bacterium]